MADENDHLITVAMFALTAIAVFLAVVLFFNPFQPPERQHINTDHGLTMEAP